MLDFTKLWDKTYLFGPNPIDFSRSDEIFLYAAGACVILGVASKIIALRHPSRSPRQYLFNRIFHLLLTIGLLASLWVGARFENIPWLSIHFTVLFIWLMGLIWGVFIFVYFFRDYRQQQKLWEDESLKQKYLTKDR